MTVEEIFIKLYTHMIKGTYIHNQIAESFGFLGLKGYQKCHEYHYYEEDYNCHCLKNFYLNNYNQLLKQEEVDNIDIISQTWYKYTRQDVDSKTRRESIENLMNKWINWEKEAKQLFETSYKQLYDLNELYAAQFISKLLVDTGKELQQAIEELLNLESILYDAPTIIIEQKKLYTKYQKKIKKIYEGDE